MRRAVITTLSWNQPRRWLTDSRSSGVRRASRSRDFTMPTRPSTVWNSRTRTSPSSRATPSTSARSSGPTPAIVNGIDSTAHLPLTTPPGSTPPGNKRAPSLTGACYVRGRDSSHRKDSPVKERPCSAGDRGQPSIRSCFGLWRATGPPDRRSRCLPAPLLAWESDQRIHARGATGRSHGRVFGRELRHHILDEVLDGGGAHHHRQRDRLLQFVAGGPVRLRTCEVLPRSGGTAGDGRRGQ